MSRHGELRPGSIGERIHDVLIQEGGWAPTVRVGERLPDVKLGTIGQTLLRMVEAGHAEQRIVGMNGHARPEWCAKEKTPDGKRWEHWAAEKVGLSAVETVCKSCGGSGTRMVPPSRTSLMQHLMGYERTTAPQRWQVMAGRFDNPRLELLQRLAQLLKSDLDSAARFANELANRIRANP